VSEHPAAVSSHPELTLSGRVRLLDVDPELGSRLSGAELARARESAMVPALHLTQGQWDIQQLRRARGVRGEVYGFVLASGAITLDVSLGARTATRALARGELILLDGWDNDTLPARWGWTVLEPSTIGVIDERLEVIAQHWPKLMTSLVIRAADQARHAMLQQAISQLPRVEDRLLAAMWSLADARGVVRQDGILVPLSLTHEALAQMVGARRPTVSLGLKALSTRGLLRATAEGWVIARDSLDDFLTDEAGSRDGCVDPSA
jgi:CRP/FNR family cyclic AMP-dependent transcriptional regulator